jgi:F-type H+-transporting ATPase subunit epsilon
MAEAFKFELVSPERMVLSADVDSVVVPGSDGDFTVLAKHAPVMTTVRPGIVAVKTAEGDKRIFIRGGFADVTSAGVTILAERAIPMEELDAAGLAAQIKAVEEDVADATDAAAKSKALETLGQLKEIAAIL